MSALDFSHFKKTAQDKKCATLMHPDGHSIRIAIANLKPELRKKLEAMPLHQAEGSEEPVKPLDNASPAEADVPDELDEGAQQEVQAAPPPPPVAAAPVAQAPVAAPVAPEAEPQEPAPVSATRPAFESEKGRVPPTPLAPEETPDEHYAKEVAFQQDLANRHIEPKTYKSLFAEKSTLGKIGTLFGLLVSGAGAGLTHSPNAVLEMMNKEIDRDLDAQKKSKDNANTFLKTQIDHDLAQSQMLHQTNENARIQQDIEASRAANAGLGQANRAINKAKVEGAGGKWDSSEEKAAAQAGADLLTKNKMLSVTVQHLDDMANNNPNAKQTVQTVIKPAVDAEIKSNTIKATSLKTAAAKAQRDTNAQGAQASNDVINMDSYLKKLKDGKFAAEHGIPFDPKKHIDPADDKEIQASITKKTGIQNNYKDVMDAYNALASLPNAGETIQGDLAQSLKAVPWIGESLHALGQKASGGVSRPRDQILDALATRLAGNGASTQTIHEMKKALSPGMFDTKDTLKKGADLVYQHFNHLPETHPGVFQKYKLDSPLPEIKFDPIAAQKQREMIATGGNNLKSPLQAEAGSEKSGKNKLLDFFTKPNEKREKSALGFTK